MNKNFARLSHSNLQLDMPYFWYNEGMRNRLSNLLIEAQTDEIDFIAKFRSLKSINFTDMGMTNDAFDLIYDISKAIRVTKNR